MSKKQTAFEQGMKALQTITDEQTVADSVNQFLVGDIMQINMGRNGGYTMADVDDNWQRFWRFPLRDREDIVMAREIVETNGSCLGYASASLNQEPITRSQYRTITPPASLIEIAPPVIDHYRNSKTGELIGMKWAK